MPFFIDELPMLFTATGLNSVLYVTRVLYIFAIVHPKC